MIKISIITVVYNNRSTVERTILSVLNQTYQNIEYIVVDGASTDGTVDILNKYKKNIDVLISENDSGIYDAMNKGLKMATGEIVGILSSDDVYFNNGIIEKIYQEFQLKKVDSLFGDLFYVKENDLSKVVRYWKSSKFKLGSFSRGWHPAHPTFFIKNHVYKKYGYFDINMNISADFELMLRFLEKHKISSTYLPKVLVRMRLGGESNKKFKNILLGNKNILLAFQKNGIKVNRFLYPIYRITPKLKQFLNRNYLNE